MVGLVNYNLTKDEEVAFKELKRRIFGNLEENTERDFLLYRFLKARKFDVDNAETMLRNNLQFREKMELDTILDNYKPEEPLKTYSAVNFMGFDKDGDVILHIHFGSLDVLGLSKSLKMEGLIQYSLYFLEFFKRRAFEQSIKLGRLVQCTLILDDDGLSLTDVTNKAAIELLIELFRIHEAHYPELLKVARVINAPIFVPYIWKTLKWCFPVETLQKIKIYARDSFQSELLRMIAPETLPAFLGGTRTDPDGDPDCLTIIKRGKEVPKHYYLKNPENLLSNEVDAEKYNLKSRSRINITSEVEIPGSFLDWQFESEAHDIGFGLFFKSKEDEDLEVVLPITRVSAHRHREIGTFMCEKPGIYIIALDNSFSWLRGKHIAMKSSIRKPKQEMEIEN